MIYKKFQDLELSALGFGCMRLPVINGADADIDKQQTADMVAYAMEKGINYFDTAWGYHSGNSELVMGEILSGYPRDSFYLATKFPGYDVNNMDKVEEIFEKQLEKCRVDYFDFYLFHNVCEKNINEYLDEKFGIMDYLLKQKENGRIKHLGFSCHGTYETMKRFMDKYGKYMEFCQIQLNWLDYGFQDAKAKVEMLEQWNIPVWVMEPLRGGKLAKLPQQHSEKLQQIRPGTSDVEWAFRYLQSFDNIPVVLSGMSNIDQLKDNIAIYEEDKPLSESEIDTLYNIAETMTKSVPCTACRYCTDHCPMGLDIPRIIELYNEFTFTGGGFIAPMAISVMPDDKKPSACIGCQACEAVCPQNIKISEIMTDFAEKLK